VSDFPSFWSAQKHSKEKTTGKKKDRAHDVFSDPSSRKNTDEFKEGGFGDGKGETNEAESGTLKWSLCSASGRKSSAIFVTYMLLQFSYVMGLMWIQTTLGKMHSGDGTTTTTATSTPTPTSTTSGSLTVMAVLSVGSLVAFMGSIFIWGWSDPNFASGMDGILMAIGLTAEMWVFAFVDSTDFSGMDMRGSGVISLLFAMGCRSLILLKCPGPHAKRFLPLAVFATTLYLRLQFSTVVPWTNIFPLLYCASFAPIWPSDDHHPFVLFVSAILTAPLVALDSWEDIFHADMRIPLTMTTASLALRQLVYTFFLSSDPKISIRLLPTVLGTVLAFPFACHGDSIIPVFLVGCCVVVHAVSSDEKEHGSREITKVRPDTGEIL